MPSSVLIIDDDESMCRMIAQDLERRGHAPRWFASAQAAFAALRTEPAEVVLTDLSMPDLNGIELCERVAQNYPDVPVIVMTGFGSLESAVAAIRAGAYDFVTKPVELEVLALAVERALSHRSLKEQIRRLREEVGKTRRFEELIGESPPMVELYRRIERIARSDAAVLLRGESGTGKELVARILHRRSERKDGPFVAVNCAAVPEPLVESELFGHVAGAYTGAQAARRGLFIESDGGTLFLDEIGEVSLAVQPKLLRALEEKSIRPVGGNREQTVDVRVIAATHRDLETAVEEGRFREDLFFRVNVISLEIPPLRARGTDVLLLAQRAIEEFAERMGRPVKGMSHPVAERLLSYPWPGNVRELRNAIEHAVALTEFDTLLLEDLPERIREYRKSHVILGAGDPTELAPLEDVERRYILHVLDAVGGNRTLASGILGLDRKTLYRKLRRYEEPASSSDREA
jgi:DNA-binding NtrC family response regulator